MRQGVNQVENQIAQIYRQHFPAANHVVAPRWRMQLEWEKLNAQADENRLLFLLGKVAKVVSQHNHIALLRFEFQHNVLTLTFLANSADDFTDFINALMGQGLSVKQEHANLVESHVNATISILNFGQNKWVSET